MTNNIGMNVFGEVKPNCKSARIRVGVTIGYQRNARGVRKSDRYWGRIPAYVRRTREGSGVRRRSEYTFQHSAFGMGRSKTRVQSEDGVELLKQILAQRNKLIVRGKWHG